MPLARREFDSTPGMKPLWGQGGGRGATADPFHPQLPHWGVPLCLLPPVPPAVTAPRPPSAALELGDAAGKLGGPAAPQPGGSAGASPHSAPSIIMQRLPEPECGAWSTKPAPLLAPNLPSIRLTAARVRIS